MQYHRARYVNPALGTFLSLDPFEGMVDRAMSMNGYGWVEGNVVNATDASGYCKSNSSHTSLITQLSSTSAERLHNLFNSGNCWSFESVTQLLDNRCGPDVTDWFARDLKIHAEWIERLKANTWWYNNPFVINSGLMWAALFADYAKAIPHKWMEYRPNDNCGLCTDRPDRVVTLCDTCIDRSELGNLMFGFSGMLWGVTVFAVWALGQLAAGSYKTEDEVSIALGVSLGYSDTWQSSIVDGSTLCQFLTSNPSPIAPFGKASWNGIQGTGTRTCSPCHSQVDMPQTLPAIVGSLGFSGVFTEQIPQGYLAEIPD